MLRVLDATDQYFMQIFDYFFSYAYTSGVYWILNQSKLERKKFEHK